tara:strand:+ start:2595 stop:2768 length:174 start_codon:yes stop_codon:yes gene_type:complete
LNLHLKYYKNMEIERRRKFRAGFSKNQRSISGIWRTGELFIYSRIRKLRKTKKIKNQ